MSYKYKIKDNEGLYFITSSVVSWIDVFIRKAYKDCLIESFNYCIENKGLNLHAYVIMSSHFHAIISCKKGSHLPSIIRDFKRYTATNIIKLINNPVESRRNWMLNRFRFEANKNVRGKEYIFWQEGYHSKQIESIEFLEQKLNYIHNNPLVEGWVSCPEDYLYSSARNYAGEMGVIDVDFLI